MIDLSFLTEAEQEAILQVLQRDAELKKAEEDRIRHLENVIDDENELKYKSGQWFYEAKSKRHRDKIHGADLVRASIRKRKKPTTLAELSKSSKNKGKKSWVNSVNKDLFIPPEQRGVMEDSEDDLEDLRPTKVETNQSAKKVSFFPTDKEKDSLNNGTASPAKQRKNPFNSANLEEPDFENENHRPGLENGTGPVKDQQRTDNLSSKVKFGVKLPYPELNEGSQTPSAAVGSPKSVGQAPLPKPRKLLKNAQNGQSLDATCTSLKRGDSVNSTGKPRGILKRCSSSSSTDSENLRLAYNIDSKLALPVSHISEVGGKSAVTALDSSPESTADKLKQVRFSSKVLQKPPSPGLEPFTGREIGEFRILEPKLSQAEGHHAVHDHTTSSQNPVNVQDSVPSLDSLSVSAQRNILEDMDARVPSNASVNSDVEEVLENATYSTGVENQTKTLEKTVPELNLVLQTNSSTGPEPIYAQVKKMPKIPSTDTSTEFDMEDSHMAPRFIGQRGKIQNIGGMGQPLEFGKSYGGSGKTRNVVSPLSRTSQGPYTFLSEENEKPEDYKVDQVAYSGIQVVQMPEIERGSDASGSPHSLLEWKRPPMLRDETWNPSSATLGPRIYEHSQQENAKARSDSSFDGTKFGTSYLGDTQHLGELRGESKYMPVNKKIVREVEEDKPRSLVTLSPERPQLSRNSGDRLNVTFSRDYQREMSPKSANFKVMSLKDRIPDASVGERPNPTQFQNIRSFWNVEGKSPPSQDIDGSPSKTLDNMLNKSRLEENLQPRSSREDSIDYLLPNSYGVLSEEEQTSHKVASWLAQTPAIYENEQADPVEQAGPSEEVVEEVQKSVSRQRVKDEEFSNALQKLREEASQIPQVPKMEKSTSSGDVKVLPVEESQIPGFKIKTATKMDYNSENNPLGLPPVEIIEKQVVSNKMASDDFKIGLEKLLAEHESLGDDDKIHEKPTKKSELNESNRTQNITFNNEMNDSDGTVEKTSVSSRKGQDEFAVSLKKPDIEVSMPPSGIDNHVDEESSEESGESFDYHPEEEVVETTAPMKSSKALKIGFEEFLDSEQRTHEAEEVIEKTIVTKNDNLEFVSALNKLKTEASLPEDTPMVEQNIEFEKQGKDVSTKEVPENIGSVGKISSMVYEKDEKEKTVKTQHSMNEATPVPVTEETVVKDDVQTNENADFYKRLLQLQQEASDPLPQELDKQVASKSIEQNTKAEEPKDLTADKNITVSLFPNKEVYITKKVYSDIDLKQSSSEEYQDGETTKETSSDLSSPGETKSEPPNKPTERTLLDIYLASNARSRAKSSGSSADQTGSKRTSLGNVIYKKPVTESPDVSKANSVDTKQGKPVQVVIPHDADSSKFDKYTIEVMKAKDESISKVLDWFNRSSETTDDENPALGMAKTKTDNNDQPMKVHQFKEEKGKNVDMVPVASISERTPMSDLDRPLIDKPSQPINLSLGPDNINGQKDTVNQWLQTIATLESIPVILRNPPYQSSTLQAGKELEFGKSNSGLGKMKHEVDKVESIAEPEGTHVLEKIKDSYVELRQSEPVPLVKVSTTEFAGKTPVLLNQESGEEEIPVTWKRPPILEKSESLQQPVSQEPKSPNKVQKRVSEFKLLSEVDKRAQYGDAAGSPSVIAVADANKLTAQSSTESDGSLVTFKKIILEDEHPSHISQLKSFWEKNKAEATKDDSRTNELENQVQKPAIKQSSKEDGLNADQSRSTKEHSKKVRKRHTLHNFFEKDLATEEVQKHSVRSWSVSESTSNKVDTLYKPSSFQNLRSFWNVGNNLKGNMAPQVERPSSNTDRPSNTSDTVKSNKPFLIKDKGRQSTGSLEDLCYDMQAAPQKEITQPLKTDLKTEVKVLNQPNRVDGYGGKTNDFSNIQGVTETISKTTVVPNKDLTTRLQKLKEMSAEPPLSVDNKVEPSSPVATTQSSPPIHGRPSGQTEYLEITRQEKTLASEVMEPPDQSELQIAQHILEFGTPKLNMEPKLQKASLDEMNDGGLCSTTQTKSSDKKEIEEVIENSVVPKPLSSSLSSRLQNLYDEYSKSKTESEEVAGTDEVLPTSGALSEVYGTPTLGKEDNSPSTHERDHSVSSNKSIEIRISSKKDKLDESRTCHNESVHLQSPSNTVVPEVIIKSSIPCKPEFGEFNIKLQKLSKELYEEPSTTSENVHPQIGNVDETQSSQDNIEEQQNGVKSHPQEVTEIVEKSFVPRKSDPFNVSLEKLANESSLLVPHDFDPDHSTLENEIFSQDDLKENQNEEKPNPQESNEVVENGSLTRESENNASSAKEATEDEIVKTTTRPGTWFNDFDAGLQKLYKESLNTVPIIGEKGKSLEIVNKIKPDGESTNVLVSPSSGTEVRNSALPSDGTMSTFHPVVINVADKKGEGDSLSHESQSLKTPGSFVVRHSLEVSKDVPHKMKVTDLKPGQEEVQTIVGTSESPIASSMGSVQQSVSKSDGKTIITQSNQDIDVESDDSVSLPEKVKQEENVQGRVAIPERQNRKEIIEKIEKPVILPRTRLNFATGLLKLYKEALEADKTLLVTKDDLKHTENTEEVPQNANKEEVCSSEQKTAFTENAEPNYSTIPANKVAVSDEPIASDSRCQGIEETVEKSVAPPRPSYAGSLEKLKKEAMDDESGKFGGNPTLPNCNRLQSASLEQEIPPLGEYGISEDSPLERRFGKGTINITLSQEARKKSELYEDHLEPTGGTPVSSNASVNESNSSLRRSTLELYLETPYRREISGSMDFELAGYVTTQAGNIRCSEDSNPILTALRRSEAKALSKPLVEVAPTSSNQSQTDIPKEDVELGNPEVPTETSFSESQFSNPEKLKRLSQSVPSFLHEETDGRDTDSASESSFRIGRHKKSPSSLTNLSGSSGMASLSSVSGSVMSVYSGDFGSVDVKGNIQFAIDYVEQLKEFHVFVSQCKDLAVADVKKQRSDPYVKSYLLPDKAKMGKRKTAVKKKTLNPAYNEILRYKIEKNALLNQRLNLSVWHNDALGRNSFLGEVDIDLATWDWNNKQMNWYPLQPRTPAAGIGLENRGEMKLALKYVPAAVLAGRGKTSVSGEVHIWIKDCSDLPLLRGNKINSFVKCTILPDTSRKSRQKTRTVDKTPNPHFNHTMVYDGFKAEDLREACVELTVWDHNRLTNHFLGGLRIGLGTGKSYGTVVDWMDSSIEESTVWEKMMSSPDTWIEAILPLRMLKVAKLVK